MVKRARAYWNEYKDFIGIASLILALLVSTVSWQSGSSANNAEFRTDISNLEDDVTYLKTSKVDNTTLEVIQSQLKTIVDNQTDIQKAITDMSVDLRVHMKGATHSTSTTTSKTKSATITKK